MPAATPRLYFQPLYQQEVFRVININTARRLTMSRHVNYGNDNYGNDQSFFAVFYSGKRHKIVQIFELLTTELSSNKMCKVGLVCYFAFLRLQFNVNYNTERYVRESFLNVHWLSCFPGCFLQTNYFTLQIFMKTICSFSILSFRKN